MGEAATTLGSESKVTEATTQVRTTRHSKWMVFLISTAMLVTMNGAAGLTAYADSPTEEQYQTQPLRANSSMTKTSEEIVTSGVLRQQYKYKSKTNIHVLRADLSNPYVKLDVMTGKENKLNTHQNVSGMAKENGAVAAVNGDYYDMKREGAPMGAQISGGQMITSPSELIGMYAFGLSKDRKPSIDHYTFEGNVTSDSGATFPLAGINKTTYMMEPDNSYSHVNKMYIYTSAWKNKERPKNSSTTATEALVRDGVVVEFGDKGGLPIVVPEDGFIIRGHGKAADYMREHMQVGATVKADYHLLSKTTGQQVNPNQFDMMVGGHTLLVENGAASGYTREIANISGSSSRARTAIGYSKDGRFVYMVTAEKSDSSKGLTLKELQDVLVSLGSWKAVNLDGGGSTTMVHRPLAEQGTTLTHNTEYGQTQRNVVNGIGVYTTAPQGEVKGMVLSGSKKLFIGQQASYSVKAYDQYYNPVEATNLNAAWKSGNSVLAWNGESFEAKKSGKGQVIAQSGNSKETLSVDVIGATDLEALYIAGSTAPLQAGTSVAVPVRAKLKDGSTVNVPAESIKWEFKGFQGNVKNGVLNVTAVDKNAKIGYAFASYDGIKTMIPLSESTETLIENFNASTLSPSFAGLPKATTAGQTSVVGGYDGRSASDKVLKLSYDMTNGAGNKFAYSVVNGSKGISLGGAPTSFTLDVYSDNSSNWLRAEVIDGSGKAHMVDVAKTLNWNGWKSLKVDLSEIKSGGPYTLKRLYVVNLEDGQEQRASVGEVAFDNMKAMLPAGTISMPKADMKLTVGSKQITVNGKKKTIDVSPLVLSGTTYVPVKVILDEFGGRATWDNGAKKVTVLRGDDYLELTVNEKSYFSNGQRKLAEVSPIIRSGRTLVPLRLVSEQLGLSVNWEPKSKSITIR